MNYARAAKEECAHRAGRAPSVKLGAACDCSARREKHDRCTCTPPPQQSPGMTASDPRTEFMTMVRNALGTGAFRRLVLGKPRRGKSDLKKLTIEPGDGRLRLLYSHATRDVTKHGNTTHALAEAEAALGDSLFSAHLFTNAGTPQFEINKKGEGRLTRGPVAEAAALAQRPHDRPKQRRITPTNAPWMAPLGLASPEGTVNESMQGKYRQLEKFIEIVDRLVADAGLTAGKPVRVVDMGSGKGYLTFAVWHHLTRNLGLAATVTGIEARKELVDLCNSVADAHGCAGLTFVAGEIAATDSQPAEIVIALHACDTATDDALFRASSFGARIIIASPCCHKEVRPQMRAPAAMEPLLRDGIQQERMAELLTDAVRARLLEAAGYRTQVFEFISTEHTAKNTMITGVRIDSPDPARIATAREEAATLLSSFGVGRQRLAEKLGVLAAKA